MHRENHISLNQLLIISVGSSLAIFAVLQLVACAIAGGFEYPLDDVYIHLAMSQNIAAGGYGVNAGEYASAASSPLYPFLFAPFSGLALQRYMPLLVNMLSMVAVAILWARIVSLSGWPERSKSVSIALCLLAPFGLYFAGVAYSGMEHSLQALAALAVIYGLARFLLEGKIGAILIAGIFLGPLMRLENTGLSLLACVVLALNGRYFLAAICAAIVVGTVAAFMGMLTAIGLDPLPSSILAKSTVSKAGFIHGMIANFKYWIEHNFVAKMMLVLTLLLLVAGAARKRNGDSVRDKMAFQISLVVGAAIIGHLCLGAVGWLNRYENYVICVLGAGFVLVGAHLQRRAVAFSILPVVLFGLIYLPSTIIVAINAPLAISLQQKQMARLVKNYYPHEVAANDIGWLAWGSGQNVLDLWGLASEEARKLRLSSDNSDWVEPFVSENAVGLVMVYEEWLDAGKIQSWQKVGYLVEDIPYQILSSDRVAFFVTPDGDNQEVIRAIEQWEKGLPEGAHFEWAISYDTSNNSNDAASAANKN